MMRHQICSQITMDRTIMTIAISPTPTMTLIVHMITLGAHTRHLLEQLCDPHSQPVPHSQHDSRTILQRQDHVSLLLFSTICVEWEAMLCCSLFSGPLNGTNYQSGNSTGPSHNYNNSPHPHGQNPNQNHRYDPTKVPNSGNYGQNYDNNRGSTTYRPFPSQLIKQITKN